MAWKFFNSSGKRKLANYNSASSSLAATEAGMIALWFRGGVPTDLGLPTGWLECDGTLYSEAAYPTLFKAIGRTYGGSSGASTFAVPNFTGALPMGHTAGSQDAGTGSGVISGGTAIGSQAIGATGGDDEIYLTAAQSATKAHSHPITEDQHDHTFNDPGHRHDVLVANISFLNGDPGGTGSGSIRTLGSEGNHSGALSSSTNGGDSSYNPTTGDTTPSFTIGASGTSAAADPHTNMQKYVRMIYMIKT